MVEYAPAEQFEQVLALGAPARPNTLREFDHKDF